MVVDHKSEVAYTPEFNELGFFFVGCLSDV